jgi:hypothetical protein
MADTSGLLELPAAADRYAGGRDVIRVAISRQKDAGTAVREVAARHLRFPASFVFLFVPPAMDLTGVQRALRETFLDTTVFGCTTAGQITTEGYENEALVALAFPASHFRFSSHLFKPLSPVRIEATARQAERMARMFRPTGWRNRLALIFADGQSKQEDVFLAALHAGLKDIPVFGGSAGDAQTFGNSFVLHAGAFHNNAALLLLIETDLHFKGLGFDHFLPTDRKMVVTHAIPEQRLVLEINGAPAAQEYARLLGMERSALSSLVFAENPMLVRNGSAYHVRAIQEIHESGGLSLFSAIDEGLLLTLGQSSDIIGKLNEGLDVTGDNGERAEFVLGFDCFLRKLEIEHKGLSELASQALKARRVIGFNTYGEQHLGVHVNQTFVGVAFFRPKGIAPF